MAEFTAVVQYKLIMNNCSVYSVENALVIITGMHGPSEFIFVSYRFLNGLVSKLGGRSAGEARLPPNLDSRSFILTTEM